MTDTTITDAVVFPQDDGTGVTDGDEDFASAGYLGLLAQATADDFVGNGLSFTVDTANDSLDVGTGHAFLTTSGVSVQSGAQTTYDTTIPDDISYVVVLPTSVTGLGLGADVNNDVWLATVEGNNDDVYIRHGNGLSAPTDPHVKLGTAHSGDGSTTRPNDYPTVDLKQALVDELSSTPSTPNTGERRLYAQSDGVYEVDSAGTVSGPLGRGGPLGLPSHHVAYADDLSNEEVARFTMTAGEVFQLNRLDCRLKGGGTDSNVSVDIYDADAATTIGSTTGGSASSGDPLGTSGAGATILVRVSTPSSGTPDFTVSADVEVTSS